MPITGSDKALMQARSGIARAGATRSGYFAPVTLHIHVAGANRTVWVLHESVELSLSDRDEPSTARFTVKPTAAAAVGFSPENGHDVLIGFGTIANRIFGGKIIHVDHRRRIATDQSPLVDVTCVDWLPLFDRRFVTKTYQNMSATAIAKDLVDTYTFGFTRLNVAPDLETIDSFPVTNEPVSVAFRRLAQLINGIFRVDAFRDVHLIGPSGPPAGRTPSAPQPLTNSLSTFHAFSHQRSVTQVRTRVIVEMQQTQVPVIGIPVGATTIPVTDDLMFDPGGTPADAGGYTYVRYGRIGTQRFTYISISELNVTPGVSYPGTVVSTAAAIGATTLEVDNTPIDDPIWAQVGEQVIFALDFDTGPNRLIQIPASGYGSITAPIEAGTQVTWLPYLAGIPASGAGSIAVTQPPGEAVVAILEVNIPSAQAAQAVIDGFGDGIHEYLMSDGRLSIEGAAQRARAELDAFGASLLTAEWVSTDLNAMIGRRQVMALTAPDALSATLPIDRVDITILPTTPLTVQRRCQGSQVKLPSLFEWIARPRSEGL